jgi:hypothetical protein
VCNHLVGYTGDFCAQCLPTHFKQFQTCQPCAGGGQDRFQFVLYGVIALTVLLIMAVGVAVLSDQYLTLATAALIAVQQCVNVGTIAAVHLGAQAALEFFQNLSVLNFQSEYSFFRLPFLFCLFYFLCFFYANP